MDNFQAQSQYCGLRPGKRDTRVSNKAVGVDINDGRLVMEKVLISNSLSTILAPCIEWRRRGGLIPLVKIE
jgi:hypothetical protein